MAAGEIREWALGNSMDWLTKNENIQQLTENENLQLKLYIKAQYAKRWLTSVFSAGAQQILGQKQLHSQKMMTLTFICII